MSDGYLIGADLLGRIRRTVDAAEAAPFRIQTKPIDVRLEEDEPTTPGRVKLAAYEGTAWRQGETAVIHYYTHSGTAFGPASTVAANTATAVNVCQDFFRPANTQSAGPTATLTWCVVSPSRGGATMAIEGAPAAVNVFRICTFTGAWSKNITKTVTFKYQTSTPNTASVTNLFAAIGTATIDLRNCAIARDGTAWFLIAAEC